MYASLTSITAASLKGASKVILEKEDIFTHPYSHPNAHFPTCYRKDRTEKKVMELNGGSLNYFKIPVDFLALFRIQEWGKKHF